VDNASLLQNKPSGFQLSKRLASLIGCSFIVVTGVCIFLAVALVHDRHTVDPGRKLGDKVARTGKEIMVCGQMYYIAHDVVLWTDEGGYDAYRTEQRFSLFNESSFANASALNPLLAFPNRFELRNSPNPDRSYIMDPGYREMTQEQLDRVRGGGWNLDFLSQTIDQFVIHYDACGLSQTCFEVLQDERDLSVHFMLDLDGTIYQTLDVKERAWHATMANTRSIGVEIANIGSYDAGGPDRFSKWYTKGPNNTTKLILPPNNGLRNQNWTGGPARPDVVYGYVAGQMSMQYDFTPEQYQGLSKLIAALTLLFPKLKLQFPTNSKGEIINTSLSLDAFREYQGILGHFHIEEHPPKYDPGPAFQWEKLMNDIVKLLKERSS
jgi:N-acetyl-anhydromuramyl-L-alanine amidase AmpD